MKWTPMNRFFVLGTASAAVAAGLLTAAAPATATAAVAPSAGGEIAGFYHARGGAPLWLAPTSGNAAQQLIQLLATAQVDGINPRRYNAKGLARALGDARRGDPPSVQRAEAMLSAAFVAYARDLKHDPHIGIIYVDPELRPVPPSPSVLLSQAAHAPS